MIAPRRPLRRRTGKGPGQGRIELHGPTRVGAAEAIDEAGSPHRPRQFVFVLLSPIWPTNDCGERPACNPRYRNITRIPSPTSVHECRVPHFRVTTAHRIRSPIVRANRWASGPVLISFRLTPTAVEEKSYSTECAALGFVVC